MTTVAVAAAWSVWRDPGGVPAPPSPRGQAGPLIAARPAAAGRLPRVVVIGHNANTELTDFVVPYAVLKRSGAAEVWALGLDPGPIRFFPPCGHSRMPTSLRSTRITRTAPTT
ncbi:hypothetical protein WJ966_27605 [Achromobacter xylosoxidans]